MEPARCSTRSTRITTARVLTRQEAEGSGWKGDRDEFGSVDVNRDGAITADEWQRNQAAFRRLDTNRDNRLTRREFETRQRQTRPSAIAPATTAAIRRASRPAARTSSTATGISTVNASSNKRMRGYPSSVGAREDYQGGYRAGFRVGYAEGFGPRQ